MTGTHLMSPKLGSILANDSDSYKYLAESIRMHPDPRIIKRNGVKFWF